MKNQLESKIQMQILDYINSLPRGKAIKIHNTVYGRLGTPDLLAVIDGIPYLLEVKRPGNDATPRQAQEIAAWQRAGAVSGVVRSVEDVQKLIEGKR